MSQSLPNDVKTVTQVIITELLKNFNNSADSIRSTNTVADLFIQSVLKFNLFKENNFFSREIQIVSEEEFSSAILKMRNGDLEIVKCIAEYISLSESRRFDFEVPYEYITDYVYSNDLQIEYVVLEDRLNLFAQCIESKIIDYDNNDIKTLEKVFRKFRRHLLLAIFQKKYIDEVTKKEARKAGVIANNAQTIANNAQQISNKAKDDSERAEKLATKAEELAGKAEDLASEADAQAKSTIANYIAILGIFASIIFTLFGGVNLISATVKLLEANSRWPYLTFIIALLMICLLTLLNMLIKWVNSINNLKEELEKRGINSTSKSNNHKQGKNILEKNWGVDFYTKSIICFSAILLISLGGMYKIKKENFFSFSTETTSKHLESNSVKNSKNTEDKLNSKDDIGNIEKTVFEKYTISNKPDNNEPDKAEQSD